jgi:hypothetical protein
LTTLRLSGISFYFVERSVFQPSTFDHVQTQVDLLSSQFPKTYDQIITLLAAGHSPSKVTRWTGIEAPVVRRIRDLHPETLSQIRQTLAMNLAEAAQNLTERLVEEADSLDPADIGKTLSIVVDKHLLLSGHATARIEHRNVPTPQELQEMFEALPMANAEVIKDKAAASLE